MRFDEKSDVAKVYFRPVKFLSKEEWEVAKRQGETPSAKRAVETTVAQTDSKPKAIAAPKVEVEQEEIAEPKKREDKKAQPAPKADLKAVMKDWT